MIKAHLRLVEKFGKSSNRSRGLPPSVAPLRLFGQERNHSTFALARMNAFIHDMEATIALALEKVHALAAWKIADADQPF